MDRNRGQEGREADDFLAFAQQNAENLLRNLKTGAAGGLVKRKHKHARAAPKTAVALLAPQGSLWTGPVEIGTPARTFQMDFGESPDAAGRILARNCCRSALAHHFPP